MRQGQRRLGAARRGDPPLGHHPQQGPRQLSLPLPLRPATSRRWHHACVLQLSAAGACWLGPAKSRQLLCGWMTTAGQQRMRPQRRLLLVALVQPQSVPLLLLQAEQQ